MPGCPTASAPGAFAASVHPETGTAFRAGRPKGGPAPRPTASHGNAPYVPSGYDPGVNRSVDSVGGAREKVAFLGAGAVSEALVGGALAGGSIPARCG